MRILISKEPTLWIGTLSWVLELHLRRFPFGRKPAFSNSIIRVQYEHRGIKPCDFRARRPEIHYSSTKALVYSGYKR